jgi:hypothetical protein
MRGVDVDRTSDLALLLEERPQFSRAHAARGAVPDGQRRRPRLSRCSTRRRERADLESKTGSFEPIRGGE